MKTKARKSGSPARVRKARNKKKARDLLRSVTSGLADRRRAAKLSIRHRKVTGRPRKARITKSP